MLSTAVVHPVLCLRACGLLTASLSLSLSFWRHELPFTQTAHLYNPWNDGKQVKIGRDGQVSTDSIVPASFPNCSHCPADEISLAKCWFDFVCLCFFFNQGSQKNVTSMQSVSRNCKCEKGETYCAGLFFMDSLFFGTKLVRLCSTTLYSPRLLR